MLISIVIFKPINLGSWGPIKVPRIEPVHRRGRPQSMSFGVRAGLV